jgi:hypothetical protein
MSPRDVSPPDGKRERERSNCVSVVWGSAYNSLISWRRRRFARCERLEISVVKFDVHGPLLQVAKGSYPNTR